MLSVNQINELIQAKVKLMENPKEEIIQEWNTRFEMLAQELSDLKDIVLHLQNYTMTVNKTLTEKLILHNPRFSMLDENPENSENQLFQNNHLSFDYDPIDQSSETVEENFLDKVEEDVEIEEVNQEENEILQAF